MSILIKGIDMPKKYHADGYYIYDDGTVRNLDRNRKLGEAVQYNDPEQRWIPCSERLPEHRLYVLVTYKHEYGLIDNGITWYSETENKWNTSREVIAWMPLPEPYKGEEE